ncbi:MAG: penicillin-binding protein [Candidatus Paceibacterota bacterium]
MSRRHSNIKVIKGFILLSMSGVFLVVGGSALWVATLKMPDLNAFENRKVSQSTKIFDRTGSVLLYDLNTDVKRTIVSLASTSPLVQKATIAIEDAEFYTHMGIRPTAIIRAVLADILAGDKTQGGSTITQQVVKNSLLTKDKTVTRKIKEWVLAIKLEKIMTKNQILETYLNEVPYGGTIYGIEEASQAFFGKPATSLTLAEAAYLAAVPQAPTYYSPYGTHRDALDARKNLVLSRMKSLNMITKEEYQVASEEKVQFLSKNNAGIKAPHFVMMVRDYLSQKYGDEAVNEGLKVITTLDFEMQKKAEAVVDKFAPSLATNFNASNTAIVAIDPKTGDILTLVGSRDYFSQDIDGNYNIALALRQPGSTFKPFVYATAFKQGYTPNTVLFDVPTQFSTQCAPDGKPNNPTADPKKVCYSPQEFDDLYPGPMIMRFALAQSRNIPAVKTLYLSGVAESMQTAEDLGITTLTDPNRYGLTLVLGGGEVRLLDLVSAYGVFANDGVRNTHRSVLEVYDNEGNVLEKVSTNPKEAIEPEIARQISDILSDTSVRMNSLKPIAEGVGRPVAIKTGTTNDYRDVWTVGYTPNLVVGAWAGNSDNTPMEHNVAGLIISPLWGAFMSQAVKELPKENFKPPPPETNESKPSLHGIWEGGVSYWKDSVSGKLATEYTPPEAKKEVVFNSVHTILHWLDKKNPTGPAPLRPQDDSQYANWEFAVRKWFVEYQKLNPSFIEQTKIEIPKEKDDVHTPEKSPKVTIVSPPDNSLINPQGQLTVQLTSTGGFPAQKTEVYVNGKYVMTATSNPLNFSFIPADVGNLTSNNTLSVILYDSVLNKAQAVANFTVSTQ